ncbi:MAG: HD domain-containing protein [Nitrospirae bacterium]|nr:HD domain-containing protein [Nitrospirota bacterium]
MTKFDLDFLKNWFVNFVRSYYSTNPDDQRNIYLKEVHTFKVCENIVEISKDLGLTDEEIILAETIALFHDIGRFPQYAKYKTFKDQFSVNHGYLGAQTIIKENILKNLTEDEKKIIIKAVRFHNVFSIPPKEKERMEFFIELIRDADKLDIWRVFIDYYNSSEEERASAAGLGLPERSDYSVDILSYIYKGQVVPQSKLKSMNDFKIMHLSWVYDLNFKTSYRLLSEREYIDRIISYLPQDENIKKMSSVLNKYVKKRFMEEL